MDWDVPKNFQERRKAARERDLAFALLQLPIGASVSVAALLPHINKIRAYRAKDVSELLHSAGIREGEKLSDAQTKWCGLTVSRVLDHFDVFNLDDAIRALFSEVKTTSLGRLLFKEHPDVPMERWRRHTEYFREDWFLDNEPFFTDFYGKPIPLSVAANKAVPDTSLFDGPWTLRYGVTFGLSHLTGLIPAVSAVAGENSPLSPVAQAYAKRWFDTFYSAIKSVDADLWYHLRCVLEDAGNDLDKNESRLYEKDAEIVIGLDNRLHGLFTSVFSVHDTASFRVFLKSPPESDELVAGVDTGIVLLELFRMKKNDFPLYERIFAEAYIGQPWTPQLIAACIDKGAEKIEQNEEIRNALEDGIRLLQK